MYIFRSLAFVVFCSVFFLCENAFAAVIYTTEDPFVGTEGQQFILDRENLSNTTVDLEFGTLLGASLSFDVVDEHFDFSHDIDLNGNRILDSFGNAGASGQVLTIDGSGNNVWENSSGPFAFGLVGPNGVLAGGKNATSVRNSMGSYSVLFQDLPPNALYSVLLTPATSVGNDDYHISYNTRNFTGFNVLVNEQDNGGSAGVPRDIQFSFLVYVP